MKKLFVSLCVLLAVNAAGMSAETAPQTKPQRNMVPDLLLPPETMWNHFAPELIPDFKIPTRFDKVLGTNMPVKILIWHTVGRNLFRTVTNGTDQEMFDSERVAMLNKGVSVLNFNCMRSKTEQVQPGGNPSDPTGLPFDSLTQIVVGDGTHDVGDNGDWGKWLAWWENNVNGPAGPLGAVRPGKPAPIFFTCTDYEGIHTSGDNPEAVNRLVAGNYAMLEKTLGYAGQMYLGPLNTLGYIGNGMYEGGNTTPAWFNPTDDGAPEKYRGLKLEGNPRVPACLEVAFCYESLLPEGHQTKDQNNKDYFKVTHFGTNSNTEHWAARVGAHVECSYQYTKPGGQKLFPMLKTVLERYGAYDYSPERKDAPGHDGRWIKEFGRFGITLPGENNTEFMGTIGSEFTTPFVTEGQMLLACFSGADGITYWGSAFGTDINPPRPRKGNPQRGQKYNDPSYGNLDLESMNYVLKAFWRMSAKATLENGKKVSFYDICDGTEEYLNWKGAVSYDNGKTFAGTRALDWQYDKKTAVRVVVNRNKKVIFILAFQPYGVEQKQVVVKYAENGANFRKTIDVPAGKVVMCAYELKGVKPVAKAK